VAGDLAVAVAVAAVAQDSDKMKSILVAAAMLVCVGVGAWIATETVNGGLSGGGAALGGLLALIIVGPLAGVGVFLLVQGGREERSMAEVQQERRLLNIVKTQGQVTVSDLVLELNSDHSQVRNWIYDLVGKGLFSGYVNWEEGVLYSEQASQLRGETRCKHCGGEIKLVGKGVVSCPYCGTEYFLS
jgi:hypothetical protein